MCPDTEDFQDTEFIEQTAEGAQHLDVDLGDLLAELESITIHQANIENATLATDRPLRFTGGTPLLLEQFEKGNGFWQASCNGLGKVSALTTTRWWNKGQAWELTPGSDGSRYARVRAKIGLVSLGKLGLQCAFAIDSGLSWLEMDFYYYDLIHAYSMSLGIDVENDQIWVLNELNKYEQVIDGLPLEINNNIFNFCKVTFDLSAEAYDRLYLNDREMSIAHVGMRKLTNGGGQYMDIVFYAKSVANNNPTCYIDDICLTKED